MKATALLVVVGALLVTAPAAAQQSPSLVDRGSQLYGAYCLACHGPSGEGSRVGLRRGNQQNPGLGPSLRGLGALAPDFYLRTGYMPLQTPLTEPRRSRPSFSGPQIRALVAYVASLGGGPAIPHPHPERGNVSVGLRLFTSHCAGCHQILGQGGYVTGAAAPPLGLSTPRQIAEAVRIGPYLMPRFPKTQISDRDLDSIIRYVRYATHSPKDKGGWAIGHIGPVPEGLVAWLIAAAVLVALAAVIGERRSG